MRARLGLLVFLVLALPAAALDLQGCVYTYDGTLLKNARMTAGILEQTPVASLTANEGCFTLANLPDALLSLTVEAEGFTTRRLLVLPGSVPLTITMLPPLKDFAERFEGEAQPLASLTPERNGGSISGSVRIGARPLAGAPLLLHAMHGDDSSTRWRVITDAKGKFSANGLPLQRFVVTLADGYPAELRLAGAERRYAEGSEPAMVDLSRERAATVDIALVKVPLITGRVLDAADEPVRGARVQVILAGRPANDFFFEPFARTAADGRYVVPAPAYGPTDQAVVIARPPRHAITRSKPFFLRESDLTIDFKLPKFERVTVRVLDAEKQPVANARVVFAAGDETTGMPDASFLLTPPWSHEAARTDANGEATLHLTPDTYDFAADAENFQRRSLANKTITRATSIEIALAPAFAIEGRVHRKNAGVANVQVLLGELRGADAMTLTDAQGRFKFEGLARGSYRLNIVKYDEFVRETVEAKAPSKIDIPLTPAGTIELRVTDAETGQPVRAFTWSLRPLGDESRPAEERQQVDREASTNDGVVRLSVPNGTYRLLLFSAGYSRTEPDEIVVNDREPAVVEVRLERGLSISGRVLDETSAPVEGADVLVMQSNARNPRTRSGPATSRSSADGTFTVSGLDETDVNVTVRKEGFVPFRQSMKAEANLAPLEVRLSRGLAIEGVVTRGGKPVAEAQVGASTPALGGDHQPAITDANGRFTIRGLVAARYTVSAYKDELHAEVHDVDPSERKELAISLDDRPRGILFGTVTGIPSNGGKVVRRIVFVASDENGSEGLIDDAGNYRIEDAPTGIVYVTAHVESTLGGVSTARRKITLVPGQPQRVDLDLGGAVRVSGRVLLDGKPLSGARVTFASYEADGAMAAAVSRDDGVYELSLASPGRYRIFAFADRLTERQFSAVRDLRGGESIDLDLREQIIEGTVLDASTRQPIADARVTLIAVGVETTSVGSEVTTDAFGRFRIATAGSGAHRLIASASAYGHRTMTLNLGASLAPVTFELSPVSLLRVRIIDAKSEAPLEAHVYLTELDGTYVPVRAERTLDGTAFTFSVVPGKYRVSAIVSGYENQTVEVTAPGEAVLRLQ
ncbi:MAG TPA: carboxypeptidase regulatory-like domain-containing protein [Thermoanaerobaculia bacterium]|nr:carboxypeptidase regulatory-like domain-containing protein [Thermoanaerobaculia bacterium]